MTITTSPAHFNPEDKNCVQRLTEHNEIILKQIIGLLISLLENHVLAFTTYDKEKIKEYAALNGFTTKGLGTIVKHFGTWVHIPIENLKNLNLFIILNLHKEKYLCIREKLLTTNLGMDKVAVWMRQIDKDKKRRAAEAKEQKRLSLEAPQEQSIVEPEPISVSPPEPEPEVELEPEPEAEIEPSQTEKPLYKKAIQITRNAWGHREMHITIPCEDTAMQLQSRLNERKVPPVLFFQELLDAVEEKEIIEQARKDLQLQLLQKEQHIEQLEMSLSLSKELFSPEGIELFAEDYNEEQSEICIESNNKPLIITEKEQTILHYIKEKGETILDTSIASEIRNFFRTFMEMNVVLEKLVEKNLIHWDGYEISLIT
jgi:hypothetical protein